MLRNTAAVNNRENPPRPCGKSAVFSLRITAVFLPVTRVARELAGASVVARRLSQTSTRSDAPAPPRGDRPTPGDLQTDWALTDPRVTWALTGLPVPLRP